MKGRLTVVVLVNLEAGFPTLILIFLLSQLKKNQKQPHKNNSDKIRNCYLKQAGSGFQEKSHTSSPDVKQGSWQGAMGPCRYLATGPGPQGGPGWASLEFCWLCQLNPKVRMFKLVENFYKNLSEPNKGYTCEQDLNRLRNKNVS